MKIIYLILGFVFLGLALLGVVLPMLPTVPFLLLVSFFFVKGSDRLNNWLINTKLYKDNIGNFQRHKGLPLKAKLSIIIPVFALLLIMFLNTDSVLLRILAVVLFAAKLIVFARMRTVPADEWGKSSQSLPSGAMD